jgi:hypothetical protein
MGRIDRRQLAVAVATRLAGVTNATGYFGQIGAQNGLPGVSDTPAAPPVKVPGEDLRVTPYFIVEPGAGRHGDEADLADAYVDLDQPFTIRAAAGDIEDLLALINRIDDRLWRWSPGVLDGPDGPVVCGPLRPPPGFDPPILPDSSVQPPRMFSPLQYVLHANT